MQNDPTFFTNEPGSTLLDRFRRTLRDAKLFDILVGYFRTSGFDKLHESFATIDKIRILVGLNVDRKAFEIIDAHRFQSTLDFESHRQTKEIFSEAGLVANREFNVELKNRADVEFALARFEELWKDAVDLSHEYVDTIHEKTWLNDEITPYHLYLKFLYEHFREDINLDEEIETCLPEGFMDLDYQKQAVIAAT